MAQEPAPVPFLEKAEVDTVTRILIRSNLRQPKIDRNSTHILTFEAQAQGAPPVLALMVIAPGDRIGRQYVSRLRALADMFAELCAGRPGIDLSEETRLIEL